MDNLWIIYSPFFQQPVVAFADIRKSIADVGTQFGPLLLVEFFKL